MALNYLTIEAFKELWTNELLPSIRKEICSELADVKRDLAKLSTKCNEIEQSQNFLSDQYDTILQNLQATNLSIQNTEKDIQQLQHQMSNNENRSTMQDEQIDDVQQYLRRDCVEITGIPVTSQDNAKSIAMEVGDLMGVRVEENDISTAHRLPASKNVTNRIIVKFVNRDKRNEFYQNRRMLVNKSPKDLPLISNEINNRAGKIHVNESLTANRKKLFGEINSFRKQQNYKYLWTMNGKILLRQNENSRIYGFNKASEFEAFKGTLFF